jgi:hypothetical protein
MNLVLYASASVLIYIAVVASGATYSQSDCVTGEEFLGSFTFEAEADPTNGRVYVQLTVYVFSPFLLSSAAITSTNLPPLQSALYLILIPVSKWVQITKLC